MIVLLILLLVRIGIPALFPKLFISENWTVKKEVFLHFIFLVLNSVAFTFYARYVGGIPIGFLLAINIVLISFIPVIFLVIITEYKFLKKRLENVVSQIKSQEFERNTEEEQEDVAESGIEFESDNQSERFFLFPEQIILIKAANNYIEIIFKQTDKVSRRLIRNTLKNTEKLTRTYPSLIRVHRSYIVNVKSIQRVSKNSDGLNLFLYDYPKSISVSRRYVLNVKKALKESE